MNWIQHQLLSNKGQYGYQKSTQVRPHTSIHPDTEEYVEYWTANRNEYIRNSANPKKPEKMKGSDNLKLYQGRMQDISETKKQYKNMPGVKKVQKVRPTTTVRPEGKKPVSFERNSVQT